jgi:hypothetical protein
LTWLFCSTSPFVTLSLLPPEPFLVGDTFRLLPVAAASLLLLVDEPVPARLLPLVLAFGVRGPGRGAPFPQSIIYASRGK